MAASQLPARYAGSRIRLEIVTPEGLALSEIVDEFTAPSVKGEFGVLPGHLPLLAALRTGLVTYRAGASVVSCAIGPGFVEVADDHAVLLTDRYASKEDVDVVRTRMNLQDIDGQLAAYTGEPGGPERQQLMADELWEATLLELYGDPPPPTMRAYDQFGPASQRQPGGGEPQDRPASERAD